MGNFSANFVRRWKNWVKLADFSGFSGLKTAECKHINWMSQKLGQAYKTAVSHCTKGSYDEKGGFAKIRVFWRFFKFFSIS